MPVARLRPGQLLDGTAYRVVRALGKGGMGAVWLVAQTRAFGRLAVLKEVVEYFDPADAQERQRALDRFEAEARTLGDLKHPGIPDLYAYFSEGDHNYLVMEYIEGPDLRHGLTGEDPDTGQLVPGGPFPADAVLQYTIQICEVLEYLASRTPPVVHNDIKPGNVIIDQNSGRAVLVDFGTAKTRYLRAIGRPDGMRASIYGTVGYAAPELFRGHSEPRSDVYSLAATAYHLLTDDDPRDHPMQYPLLEGDRIPPALAGILRHALAEDVEDRPTAAEFRNRIQAYLAGQTGPLQPLTFPGGDTADERDELLALAIRHWSYAAGILHDGTLADWLRRTLHDPVAAQAAEVAVQRWPHNPDAALDDFLRQLDPSILPPGRLALRTGSIQLLEIAPNQHLRPEIQITNKGQGYLHGEIFATKPWVKVNQAFACPPGRTASVPIEIDTTGLPPGQPQLAAVTLAPHGGEPEVVAIQVSVTASHTTPVGKAAAGPAVAVSHKRVDFGIISRQDLSAGPVPLTVTNLSQAEARVQIQGAPRWLLVNPETFSLAAGAQQVVQLIARIDRVRHAKEEANLKLIVEGGTDQEVKVGLKLKRRGFFG
jgi:serine/threonine protein kinase